MLAQPLALCSFELRAEKEKRPEDGEHHHGDKHDELHFEIGQLGAGEENPAGHQPSEHHPLCHQQRRVPVVRQFFERGLIPDSAQARFDAALASALRLRNSIWAEPLLLAFVYVVGVGFVWRTQVAPNVTSWHGAPVNGAWQPSLAGWWLVLVSVPVFQFLLFRWYFRQFIWARFLWHVSRIELRRRRRPTPRTPCRRSDPGVSASAVRAAVHD